MPDFNRILASFIGLALFNLPALADHDATGASSASDAEIIFHTTPEGKAAGFPFSNAVEVDGWIYLSGTLGIDPDTRALAPGGIEAEAAQTMQNIKTSLHGLGLSMDRIVKCTVMIEEMADWPAFNEVYKTFFDGTYPARSAFGADGLALGALVEVECIARR